MLSQGRAWNVRKVNLIEVSDPIGLFKRTTGFEPEDIYNKRLARLWQASQSDLVVSLIPNFNRALHDGLALVRPFVTVLTDMADHPPNFWSPAWVADECIHETADVRKLCVTHGDHIDGVIQCAKWLAYVGDWAYEPMLRISST